MTESSFIKNILVRLTLTIPLRFRGIIVLPLLTRLYPEAIYGAWLQILLISGVLKNLLSLQFEAALVRYLSGEKKPKETVKALFTVTFLCCLCFIAFVWVFGDNASKLIFGSADYKLILRTASLWILVQACMRIGLSVLRSQEKIGTLSVRELLSALWLILGVAVSYLMKLDIHQLVFICFFGDSILLIWIMFEIGTPFPLKSLQKSLTEAKRFMPFTIPLIFSSLFLWFTRSIDRFLIVQVLGLAHVGIYGVAIQIASLLLFVLKPINFVLFPRTATSWNNGDMDNVNRYFSHAVTITFILGLPLLVGIFMTSDGIIGLLAGGKYITERSLILALLLACFSSMIYQNHLYVIHLVEKTYILPFLFVCTALMNFIMGYFLLTHMGLIGAAISRTITLTVMAIIVTLWARRYVKFQVNWLLVGKVGLASFAMGLVIKSLPMNTWSSLIMKIIMGMIIFVVVAFLLKVVTRQQLDLLKSEFIK